GGPPRSSQAPRSVLYAASRVTAKGHRSGHRRPVTLAVTQVEGLRRRCTPADLQVCRAGVGRGTRSGARASPPTWSHSLVRTQKGRRGQRGCSGGAEVDHGTEGRAGAW